MLFLVILVILSPFCLMSPISNTEQELTTNYFKQYGYLPNNYVQSKNNEGFLKNAIKNFERFSGLEKTGEINDGMINMMKQPRCGVPDIYPAKSRFLKFVTARNKWIARNLGYKITKYSKKISRNVVDRTITDAFNLWTNYTNLSFSKTNGSGQINIGFYTRVHRDGNRISSFDGPGKTIAHAYYPPSGIVHFDDDENWSITYNRNSKAELFQTVVHEIGHALGLGHSPLKSSVMYAFHNGDINFRSGLHQDDINGIQYLYGRKTKSDKNMCRNRTITSAVSYNNVLYVFKNGKFISEKTPGVTKNVNDVWKGIDKHSKVLITESKIYFFSGDRFWRFTRNKMDAGYPQKISQHFLGIPNNIDAAVLIKHILYVFKGENYWVFNPSQIPRVSSVYPQSISKNFRGLPSNLESVLWTQETDELFAIKDGEVYFYSFGLNMVYLKENLTDYFMCEM